MEEREREKKKKHHAHCHDKICANTQQLCSWQAPNTHANSVTSLSNLHMMTLLGAIQKLRGHNFTQF
jgi:hypothetical protein